MNTELFLPTISTFSAFVLRAEFPPLHTAVAPSFHSMSCSIYRPSPKEGAGETISCLRVREFRACGCHFLVSRLSSLARDHRYKPLPGSVLLEESPRVGILNNPTMKEMPSRHQLLPPPLFTELASAPSRHRQSSSMPLCRSRSPSPPHRVA